MIFLLEYDRKQGKIRRLKCFDSADRAQAQRERLTVELDLRKSHLPHEVVLLEATDKEALMRTHGRYFMSARESVESMIQPEPNCA